MKTLVLILASAALVLNIYAQQVGSFTDPRDGKTYKTITIGTQTWMAENLAFKPSSGNYWAYNNNQSNVSKYGYLYDWETASNSCPTGWHLPNSEEWKTITEFLGGESIAGTKLKSKNGWNNKGYGTDIFSFSALPAGKYYNTNEKFDDQGYYGYWWGENSIMWSYGCSINSDSERLTIYIADSKDGLSVRCLRD
jgi:uncharacterized protein (TIGR02145 family)